MTAFPSLVKPAEISVIVFTGGAAIFCKPDGVFAAIKCAPAMSSILPPAGELGFTHTLLATSGKSASFVQLCPPSRETKRPGDRRKGTSGLFVSRPGKQKDQTSPFFYRLRSHKKSWNRQDQWPWPLCCLAGWAQRGSLRRNDRSSF